MNGLEAAILEGLRIWAMPIGLFGAAVLFVVYLRKQLVNGNGHGTGRAVAAAPADAGASEPAPPADSIMLQSLRALHGEVRGMRGDVGKLSVSLGSVDRRLAFLEGRQQQRDAGAIRSRAGEQDHAVEPPAEDARDFKWKRQPR